MLEQLDFDLVRERYDDRLNVHLELLNYLNERMVNDYVLLALGISNRIGNYSASEYGLGPEVLANNLAATIHQRVFNLAVELRRCLVNHVPRVIYDRDISYLKISVGSEMGLMIRPEELWVGNIRTYWVHMMITNDWNAGIANEAVEMYQNNERNNDLEYRVWRDLYLAAGRSLETLVEAGNIEALNQDVEPGYAKFLWADAIATSLYEIREEL